MKVMTVQLSPCYYGLILLLAIATFTSALLKSTAFGRHTLHTTTTTATISSGSAITISNYAWSSRIKKTSCNMADIKQSVFTGGGSVLLAQPKELDRFLVKSVILIYEHNARGTLGCMINKPTAFTMGESSPNIGVFQSNTLFMGGTEGSDMAVMFHSYELGGFSKKLDNGLYVGGLRQARELCEAFEAKPKDFKFVFNNVQWAPGLIEKEIAEGRWDVCQLSTDLIVNQDEDSYSNLWSRSRNVLSQTNSLNSNESYDD